MLKYIFEMLGNSCSIHTKKLNHTFGLHHNISPPDDYLHLTILS